MKRVYLSFLVLLFAIFQLSAQTYKVVYEYDHAGNPRKQSCNFYKYTC